MGSSIDQRDARTWVVLELTRAGEGKVDEGGLEGLLREALSVDDKYPVFIPAVLYTRGTKRVAIQLMEGYAFVATGLPEVAYYKLEHSCPYVRQVLTVDDPHGMRVLSVIPNTSILEMRRSLHEQIACDIKKGMHVNVTEGLYSALEGEVLEVGDNDAHVRITLRSLDLIVRIPRVFLSPESSDES